jgi:hypothetical protein
MTTQSPSVVSRLVVAGLFTMFLFVASVGVLAVGQLALLAPTLFAASLVVGAFGVGVVSQGLNWWGQRPARAGNRVAMAFGGAGLVCITVASLVFGLSGWPPQLLALALAFVAVATATLSAWPGRPLSTFAGLWVLAIGLMTAYWSGADDAMTGGFGFTLYIGALLGTATYGVWIACGLLIVSLTGSDPR